MGLFTSTKESNTAPTPTCHGGQCRVVMPFGFSGHDAVPAVESVDIHEDWNVGVNSVDRLDGDLRTIFQIGIGATSSMSFAAGRADVDRFDLLRTRPISIATRRLARFAPPTWSSVAGWTRRTPTNAVPSSSLGASRVRWRFRLTSSAYMAESLDRPGPC